MNNNSALTTKEEYLKGKCEACGYYTFKGGQRSSYDICPVCFWEDDEYHDDPDESCDGPNHNISVNAAKTNFNKFGASTLELVKYARSPKADELHV